jgi:two-component system, NarL family, sensor kinase
MEKWQDPKVLALWIAIVIVLIFTILLFVVKIMHAGYKKMTEANLRQARLEVEHQKKLMETGLLAQEKERTRIAADLHDGLIGKLTVVRMKSQISNAPLDIDTLLGESIAEARRISHDLMPPLIEYTALHELIGQLAEPWKQKIIINYSADVRTGADVTAQVKIQLIRVVQELITNIIKHAQATTITITLRHSPKNIALLVTDNGRGFDTSVLKQGLGLGSLEMRAQYLNGRYRLKSAPGAGTSVLLAIPLPV